MKYTGIELLWLFLLYSFFGWALETAAGTIRQKRFVNRGFTTGPFCTVYGVAAVLMTTILQELRASFLFLFLGCMVLGTGRVVCRKDSGTAESEKMVGLL